MDNITSNWYPMQGYSPEPMQWKGKACNEPVQSELIKNMIHNKPGSLQTWKTRWWWLHIQWQYNPIPHFWSTKNNSTICSRNILSSWLLSDQEYCFKLFLEVCCLKEALLVKYEPNALFCIYILLVVQTFEGLHQPITQSLLSKAQKPSQNCTHITVCRVVFQLR